MNENNREVVSKLAHLVVRLNELDPAYREIEATKKALHHTFGTVKEEDRGQTFMDLLSELDARGIEYDKELMN